MRIWLVALALIAIAPVPIARADDCENPSTQTGMNVCEYESFKKADAELNALYRQITSRMKDGANAAEPGGASQRSALVKAQRAWVAYRDAECAFVGSRTAGGSVNAGIVASCLTGLTNLRIEDFKYFLKCEEGDLSCPITPK